MRYRSFSSNINLFDLKLIEWSAFNGWQAIIVVYKFITTFPSNLCTIFHKPFSTCHIRTNFLDTIIVNALFYKTILITIQLVFQTLQVILLFRNENAYLLKVSSIHCHKPRLFIPNTFFNLNCNVFNNILILKLTQFCLNVTIYNLVTNEKYVCYCK